MRNVIEIDGHRAVVSFDPEIGMFRGEFINLSGGADFYGRDVNALREEGATSLRIYLDTCRAKGIEPYRHFSGRFNLRLPPELHERAVVKSEAEGKSLNEWIVETVREAAMEDEKARSPSAPVTASRRTSATAVGGRGMTYWIYRDSSNQYRWRLRAGNQRIVAVSGEGYVDRAACIAAIELLKSSNEMPVRDEFAA